MKQLQERLTRAAVRMDALLLLAGMVNDGDAIAEPLRDLLDEQEDAALLRCFPRMPAGLLRLRDEDLDEWRAAFCDWATAAGALGFVVRFATPVLPSGDGSGSWCRYTSAWLYGDTLDEAVERGLAWAAARRAAWQQGAGLVQHHATPARGDAR